MRIDPAGVRLADYRRIVVSGPTGSGKTTLARALAKRLGLEVIEMDSQYHLPNWQVRSDLDFFDEVERAVETESWVLDGNYTRTRFLTLPRAELVIWLHFPLGFTFRRLLWRTVRRCARREELWHGCRENWKTSFFSKESILLWLFKSHPMNRARLEEFKADPSWSHIPVLEFRNPAVFRRWLIEEGLDLP